MTRHMDQKMNRRGISAEMVALACDYGELRGDKYVLDRRASDALLASLDLLRRKLLKVRDKGGVVVVENDNALLTTYNRNSFRRSR